MGAVVWALSPDPLWGLSPVTSITLLMISKTCRGWCRFERQAEAHLDDRTEKVVTMGKRAEGDNFEYLSAVDRSQHVSDAPALR